jgi:hypothetical protein
MSKIKSKKQFKEQIDAALNKLGLMRISTMSMKLKPKAA